MPSYRVKPGYTHGAINQYKAGDTVELTEQEARGFLDKLVLVGESRPVNVVSDNGGNVVEGGLLVTPADLAKATDTPNANGQPPATTGNEQGGDAPSGESFDVASATVDEVLAAAKEGKVTASDALIAEQQGKKRSSLIEALTKLVEAEAGQ